MSEFQNYIKLIESGISHDSVNTNNDSNDYLFSLDAESLYESSGISLYVLIENRIDWLRDNLMYKLEPLADKENKSAENLFNWIIDQDPSIKKQYSQWLMKILVGKNAQSSLRDLEQAKRVLSKYDELKKENKLNPEHKDLNQFKSITDLSNAISDTENRIKVEYDDKEKKARNESTIIQENNVWLVVIPKTEYAAGYWGKETLWCTATGFEGGRQEERTNNMFDSYHSSGNLYIIYNKKQPKKSYQISVIRTEFKDSENDTVPMNKRAEIVQHFDELVKVIIDEAISCEKDIFSKLLNFIPLDHNEYVMDAVKRSPKAAYEFIKDNTTNYDVEPFEDIISTDAQYSMLYAIDVLNGRFEKGEDAIANSAYYSFNYALDILDGRFEKGEPVIATDPKYSYQYAKIILGRFLEGEDVIATSPKYSCKYAIDVVKGRFPEGEDVIATDSQFSYNYALDALNDRFEKGEDAIAESSKYSFLYSKHVIKGVFEKAKLPMFRDGRTRSGIISMLLGEQYKKGNWEYVIDTLNEYDIEPEISDNITIHYSSDMIKDGVALYQNVDDSGKKLITDILTEILMYAKNILKVHKDVKDATETLKSSGIDDEYIEKMVEEIPSNSGVYNYDISIKPTIDLLNDLELPIKTFTVNDVLKDLL